MCAEIVLSNHLATHWTFNQCSPLFVIVIFPIVRFSCLKHIFFEPWSTSLLFDKWSRFLSLSLSQSQSQSQSLSVSVSVSVSVSFSVSVYPRPSVATRMCVCVHTHGDTHTSYACTRADTLRHNCLAVPILGADHLPFKPIIFFSHSKGQFAASEKRVAR